MTDTHGQCRVVACLRESAIETRALPCPFGRARRERFAAFLAVDFFFGIKPVPLVMALVVATCFVAPIGGLADALLAIGRVDASARIRVLVKGLLD